MPLPSQMRAIVLTGHGGLDRLVYRTDVPVPRPSSLEVLIEVAACGINNTDINTRTGWYSGKVKTALTKEIGLKGAPPMIADTSGRFPRIQGADSVGRIVGVGSAIDATRVGDRVIVDPNIRDMALPKNAQNISYIGTERDGGFAEYLAVPAQNAIKIDSTLDDASLASFACSYSTAEEMLSRVDLRSGETILITGASGGVGSANIQLSKLRGAKVIAVASAHKEYSVRALGADMFISRENPDLYKAVVQLVGKNAIDVVADVTGGPALSAMLRTIRRAGRYVSAGAIAGAITEIDLRQLIYKDLAMYGVTNPSVETFASLVRYIEKGMIRPLVSKTFELKELAEAQKAFIEKSHTGKIVVVVKEPAR
jgi:NADPH:quinone reductase-like Zn-dependent oxidoreductase